MKKFKRLITMTLAAVMAVSTVGIGAFAAELDSQIDMEQIMENVIGVGDCYFYGNDATSTSELHFNEDKQFNVECSSSSSEYESNFGIGVNKLGQRVRFTVEGFGGADNQKIKISICRNNNGELLSSKTVTVEQYSAREIYFTGFAQNIVYYIKVEPVDYSKPFYARITISKG